MQKKTVLLILIVALSSIVITSVISILLSKVTNIHISSLGTIKVLGLEAYWDINLQNKTEVINWGTIWPGSSRNVTLYLRSISRTETTLNLQTENWSPTDILDYMTLSWNYNGKTIHPGEIIQVTLTLSAPSSNSFILYVITNKVNQFSFDIIIGTRSTQRVEGGV